MKNIENKKIIFMIISSIFFSSCSQNNSNFDIDLSNLPKPKAIKNTDLDSKDMVDSNVEKYVKDLIPLRTSEEISAKIKLGKSDPFSEKKFPLNKLKTDLKLNGFLNTESKKYVLVTYLGNEGAISEESIGGINTNLLPEGAQVRTIDLKSMKLIINFEKKEYSFDL